MGSSLGVKGIDMSSNAKRKRRFQFQKSLKNAHGLGSPQSLVNGALANGALISKADRASKTLLPPVLEFENLIQTLTDPERGEQFTVRVKQKIRIESGDFVALVGLRSPSHPKELGHFQLTSCGQSGAWTTHDLKAIWTKRQLSKIEELRRSSVGFALQTGELLPSLTVRENIAAPLRLNGMYGKACWDRVNELLSAFGLAQDRQGQPSRQAWSRVNKLSGGEYQRVALARAIAHKPSLVFVDEPTSALNRELAWGALEQFRLLQTQPNHHGATIMITHDEELAKSFSTQIIRMAPVKGKSEGEVVEICRNVPHWMKGLSA